MSATLAREAAFLRRATSERNRLREAALLALDAQGDVLGCLHVIAAKANLLERFAGDPNLQPEKQFASIQDERTRAHHRLVAAGKVIRERVNAGRRAAKGRSVTDG
jgi:hypothetical protein